MKTNQQGSSANTECIRRWVEILHCRYQSDEFAAQTPPVNRKNLGTLCDGDYKVVGSTLPPGEYDSALEVVQQFAEETWRLSWASASDAIAELKKFNIRRPFREYDAINLCVEDLNADMRMMTTFILVAKGLCSVIKDNSADSEGQRAPVKSAAAFLGWEEVRIQLHRDFNLALVMRKKPFGSLVMRR